MAKNGPGVALNRPQDTERYNAKDSIVRRAVKCSCLVSKTKWAMLGALRPFIPVVLSVPVPSSRHLLVDSRKVAVADQPWRYGNCGTHFFGSKTHYSGNRIVAEYFELN